MTIRKEINRKKREIEETGHMIKNKRAKKGEQKKWLSFFFFLKKSPLYLSVCLL